MFLADDYRAVLGADLESLEASSSTVIGLRDDLSIGFANSAFFRFAANNGGDGAAWFRPERPITDAMVGPPRDFYGRLFRRVLMTGKPEHHDYQCPSPELFRRFRVRATPRDSGLVLVHHLITEHPHDELPHAPDPSLYVSADGVIVQCCHCRSTRRRDEPETWDFVPAWVEDQPENLSHGFCRLCFRHYYPELARKYDERPATPRRD